MDRPLKSPSPLTLYREAKRLLRTTSRAKEPDWYRGAHELNLQWHLWIGTHSGASAIYSRSLGQWWTGPSLPAVTFETDENGAVVGLDKTSRDSLHELLRKIFAAKEFGAKAKSLGIVLHLADGLRIRNLSPDFAADADFEALNELLISAPEIALGDDTLRQGDGKWRLLPLLGLTEGEKRSVAVQVSSNLAPIAAEFRHYGEMRNLPVVVNARCAPLESLSAAFYLEPGMLTPGEGPTLVLVQYESMTLLFAIGNRGELLLVRPLIHRGTTHLSDAETFEVISQTAALLNIKDSSVLLISQAGLPESELSTLLETYRDQFPNARIRCINARQTPLTAEVPSGLLEFAVATQAGPPSADEAPFQKELRTKWAWMNFYGLSKEEAIHIPTRADLRLLKFSGIAQKVALVGILAFFGWTSMEFISKLRSDAWALPQESAAMMEAQLLKLQKEKKEWEHWDNLLAKRSEGWLALEALLELFPADGGMILKEASYRTEALASTDKKDKGSDIGMSRLWNVTGYANPEVATALGTLGSRTRVAELLNEIAKRNHAPYLAIDSPTRALEVTLQQRQGAMPSSPEIPARVARYFRTFFELAITQSLTSQDDLALNTKSL